MSNLAFGNQDRAKIAATVEEKLHKEIGAQAPVPFQVEEGEGGGTTAGTVMGDVLHGLVGGKENLLFTIHFTIPQPRPAELRVHVNRQGIGAHVGGLLYSTMISKPAHGEVTLEGPKTFGTSKFTGDPETSGKLNAKGDLLKRLGKLARTESESGGQTIKAPRVCKVAPEGMGSIFILNSLPRSTGMGFGAALDAKEFLDLAGLVEAAL